jgi:hypothetical protein
MAHRPERLPAGSASTVSGVFEYEKGSSAFRLYLVPERGLSRCDSSFGDAGKIHVLRPL